MERETYLMHYLKKLSLKKFSHIIQSPSSKMLPVLNKLLPMLIPFNYGHKITIQSISDKQVKAHLPFIIRNKNHISTLHACAIATLGEFTAGILLLQHFPIANYRMILKHLNTEYNYQAKTALNSVTNIPEDLFDLKNQIDNDGVIFISLKTDIFDTSKNLVATTHSTWQFKRWEDTHSH